MSGLSSVLRGVLDRAVGEGRGIAEVGAVAALTRLGVTSDVAPVYLSEVEVALRDGLRARGLQLGDALTGDVAEGAALLVGEVAYEQWHRLLFARFLSENGLLIHPEYGARVSLEECAVLAGSLGEPDAWSVAARFASAILPGIFRVDDHAVRVRFAPEDRLALELVVTGLPAEVFTADDALGWVYQYWQSKQKKLVNESGRKIGGADIAPVTQLFTEDYMVRFLLENSLGAWWAARHPHSPLIVGWEYLRFDDDRTPAAGTFDGWPESVAEVTVMDPCCGSGHFLVAAFGMLWRMRAEEEALSPAAAQDAVLRENLFGLELDPRCTQIAMFNLALEAWKQGGYRELPVPNVACSGIPAKAPLAEWLKLAAGNPVLEYALTELHTLFRDADTLGSLIDPRKALDMGPLESIEWEQVAPLLQEAMSGEDNPAAAVFGTAAADTAHAADLLSREFTLIATNPPWLARSKQSSTLRAFCEAAFSQAKGDLAVAMMARIRRSTSEGGAFAAVVPDKLLSLGAYRAARTNLIRETQWSLLVRLGPRAFSTPMFDLGVILCLWVARRPSSNAVIRGASLESHGDWIAKANALTRDAVDSVGQSAQLANPDARVSFVDLGGRQTLKKAADSRYGLRTGDAPRLIRMFWELPGLPEGQYERLQSTVSRTTFYGGMEQVVRWEWGRGALSELARQGIASIQGGDAWGRRGVCISLTGRLNCSLYLGDRFDNNVGAVWPVAEGDLRAIWAFCSSPDYARMVRELDSSIKVTNQTLLKVPFDVDHWRAVGEERFPDGLPEPFSDDPTQWLFRGVVAGSADPLQVAVARLLGFSWPDQESDVLDALADVDGIVCLPPVSGESSAADRLRGVLAAAYGVEWSTGKLDELLVAAGGKPGDLEGWLRDVFFRQHAKVFQNRPFIWHVSDGRADGFSALVNYHRLNRQTLEKLTYTTLGWWIQKQNADAQSDVAGAAVRLGAAQKLKEKLELILRGEAPHDIYVRWKTVAKQPIGWDPDLDDGVRVNIRPFVEAGLLRSKFTVNWKKDRGTNPDGSERHNDIHLTIAEKTTTAGGDQ